MSRVCWDSRDGLINCMHSEINKSYIAPFPSTDRMSNVGSVVGQRLRRWHTTDSRCSSLSAWAMQLILDYQLRLLLGWHISSCSVLISFQLSLDTLIRVSIAWLMSCHCAMTSLADQPIATALLYYIAVLAIIGAGWKCIRNQTREVIDVECRIRNSYLVLRKKLFTFL